MPISFDTLKREHDAVHIPEEHNPELLVCSPCQEKRKEFSLNFPLLPLQRLTKPHVDSFNSLFEGGLDEAVADLDVKDIADQSGNRLYCEFHFCPFFSFLSFLSFLFLLIQSDRLICGQSGWNKSRWANPCSVTQKSPQRSGSSTQARFLFFANISFSFLFLSLSPHTLLCCLTVS